MPTTTEDGRWIVVDGRRWRATDPSIPAALRAELVAELMDARRGVGRATRNGDEEAERQARTRVQDAKVALGERGEPWWEPPTAESRAARATAAVLALARHRAPGSTICPSDAARAIGGAGWRRAMDDVREQIRELAMAGEVEVLQRGSPVDPTATWRGPVRVRLADDEIDTP